MHHTEDVIITLRGLSSRPKTYTLPRHIAKELHAYIESRAVRDSIPAEEVFPVLKDDVQRPATVLRGMRYRERLTQKALAQKLGIRQHHLSEMENGKRPIGKEMAKKLAAALNTDWRVFL